MTSTTGTRARRALVELFADSRQFVRGLRRADPDGRAAGGGVGAALVCFIRTGIANGATKAPDQ